MKKLQFERIIENALPDEESRMTLLYFLSLLAHNDTKQKYIVVFSGGFNTGKTTICNIMHLLFPGKTARLPYSFNNLGKSKIELPAECTIVLDGEETFKKPIDRNIYNPTSHVVIASNYAPRFNSSDSVDNLITIPFSVPFAHNPACLSALYISDTIKNEKDSILEYLDELYERLQTDFDGKIPLSQKGAQDATTK